MGQIERFNLLLRIIIIISYIKYRYVQVLHRNIW